MFQLLLQVVVGGVLIWAPPASCLGTCGRARAWCGRRARRGPGGGGAPPGVREPVGRLPFHHRGRAVVPGHQLRPATWPGPKVGTSLPVVYDPERPWRAERAGVLLFKLCLTPLTLAFGVFLLCLAVRVVTEPPPRVRRALPDPLTGRPAGGGGILASGVAAETSGCGDLPRYAEA